MNTESKGIYDKLQNEVVANVVFALSQLSKPFENWDIRTRQDLPRLRKLSSTQWTFFKNSRSMFPTWTRNTSLDSKYIHQWQAAWENTASAHPGYNRPAAIQLIYLGRPYKNLPTLPLHSPLSPLIVCGMRVIKPHICPTGVYPPPLIPCLWLNSRSSCRHAPAVRPLRTIFRTANCIDQQNRARWHWSAVSSITPVEDEQRPSAGKNFRML